MKKYLLALSVFFGLTVAQGQTFNLDAGISAITKPIATYCTNTFSPTMQLKNFGTDTLKSCTINYQIDALGNQTYSWNGLLATGQIATVTLSSMTVAIGTHTFVCSSSIPNGGTDQNITNDKFTSVFAADTYPYHFGNWGEGFESSNNLLPGWALYNPDNDASWQVIDSVGYNSSHCIAFNNCNGDSSFNTSGRIDRFFTGQIPCNVCFGMIGFNVAYAPKVYQNNLYTDTLNLYYSTDCGNSWTRIYHKGGMALATAPPDTVTSLNDCWHPKGSDWRSETVNGISGGPGSWITAAFENSSGNGSWIYIDSIQFSIAYGIQDLSSLEKITISPNPFSSYTTLHSDKLLKNATLTVYNSYGQQVKQLKNISGQEIKLQRDNLLPKGQASGLYFIRLIQDSQTFATEKLVITD